MGVASILRTIYTMICPGKSNRKLRITAMQIMLLLSPLLMSQLPQDTAWVRFGPGYSFRDGIYVNFEMVKTNSPISPSRVVSDLEVYNKKFYKRVLSGDYLVLHDNQGVEVTLDMDEIWGYAYKDVLYLQLGGKFHRLLAEGSISRFVASTTIWKELHPIDPVGYRPYSDHSKRYSPIYVEVTKRHEIFFLDFEENTMKGSSPESLLELMEGDSLLHQEYASLPLRQQEKKMPDFLRRYNENHPIYLPSYEIQ